MSLRVGNRAPDALTGRHYDSPWGSSSAPYERGVQSSGDSRKSLLCWSSDSECSVVPIMPEVEGQEASKRVLLVPNPYTGTRPRDMQVS